MDHVDVIRNEGDAFYATAFVADTALEVPSCPGWTIADLAWHLGEVHWFWSTIIDKRASDPDTLGIPRPERPSESPELMAWGRSMLERLVRILETNDDTTQVWTWAKDPARHTVGFIRRHQVQETAVHRWDMQRAAHAVTPDPIEPAVASDSIDEFLDVSLPWVVDAHAPLPGSVHLHCTDTEGEWFIEPDGHVERAHAKGDVAVRGTASDLLLALYRRIDLDAVDVIGNDELARSLIERVDTN